MNKGTLGIIGILVLIVLVGGCQYNGLVGKDQNVKSKWSQVQKPISTPN